MAFLGRHPCYSPIQKVVRQISYVYFSLNIVSRVRGEVVDFHGSKIKYYPEVPEVLKKLKEQGFEIGVASRTSEIKGAEQLLDLFGWNKYFTYKEIFPGSKVTHFNK